MPIPSPADFRNKSKKHSEVREMLAQMAESVESKEDSTTKANTAKSEAITAAATDATTKANTAQANAIAAAATGASAKANTAQANAIAAAATDATTKANAAEANAKTYADSNIEKLSNKLEFDAPIKNNYSSDDLLQLSDASGRIYALFDKDSQFKLLGMFGKSVQDLAKAAPESNPSSNDIFELVDAKGSVTLRQSSDGSVYIPMLGQESVQHRIINSKKAYAPRISNSRYANWHFSSETNNYLAFLTASGSNFAPPFLTSMPSKFTIPDTIVDGFDLSYDDRLRLSLDSPYFDDDKFVHPYIFECVNEMRGFRYILCVNPFTQEVHENPVVYGSNDMINFEMLTGFTQPLAEPVGDESYLSDSGFAYDPRFGRLICYWRTVTNRAEGGYDTTLWYKDTLDLESWSDKKVLYPSTPSTIDPLVSPALIFNPKTDNWHLYTTKNSSLICRTSKDMDGTYTIVNAIFDPIVANWHQEVKWVGDKMVCLFSSNAGGNLSLAISSDGIEWTYPTKTLFPQPVPRIYKASFLPIIENGYFYLRVFYTVNASSETIGDIDVKRLFTSTTNSINIGV